MVVADDVKTGVLSFMVVGVAIMNVEVDVVTGGTVGNLENDTILSADMLVSRCFVSTDESKCASLDETSVGHGKRTRDKKWLTPECKN